MIGDEAFLKLTSCTLLKNGQDARSTKDKFYCGTGILPVHKSLIENGGTSQFKRTAKRRSTRRKREDERRRREEKLSIICAKIAL